MAAQQPRGLRLSYARLHSARATVGITPRPGALPEELMAFFDFPAQHWQSIRTSNPIESAFATIRHRTKRSKGCLSRDGMLHMMFKLGQCAEQNWRKLRGFDYLAKVITGVTFKDGIEAINPSQIAA